MAKIYGPPEHIQPPPFDINKSWEEQDKEENTFLEELRKFCKENGKGDLAGEIVRDQVADGYAQYMIHSLRPLVLIHIPLCDAYQSRWAHRWTAADVKRMVEQEKALARLFNRKSA